MRKKALKREDRKRQILLAFMAEMQSLPHENVPEMTVADIARKLHLSPSTKLREMITELVIEGELIEEREDIPGIAKFRRIYSLNPDKVKRYKPQYKGEKRPIKINSKQGSFFAEMSS